MIQAFGALGKVFAGLVGFVLFVPGVFLILMGLGLLAHEIFDHGLAAVALGLLCFLAAFLILKFVTRISMD